MRRNWHLPTRFVNAPKPLLLLQPHAVTTDSNHRIFVTDITARVVHVFDFANHEYSLLGASNQLRLPLGIATDREGNVYVSDSSLRTVFVYDSKGKFIHYLKKPLDNESYFDAPRGIAVDPVTEHIYVVLYEDDPATGRGYIYLPGTGDEWYGLNMGTIARGVEGHWFRARRGWDRVARPLIAGAKVTASEEQPGLELRLQPEDVEAGVPEAFTFVLVNGSNHDVRVPMPSIECEDPPFDGNIRLKVEFRPLRPDAPGFGSGCSNDRMDDPPAIMNRVQNWKNLHPGESLSLKAVRKRLLYRYEEPGTYEFCALYFPPSVTPSDREALNQAGIDFPQNELISAHVTFVKEP